MKEIDKNRLVFTFCFALSFFSVCFFHFIGIHSCKDLFIIFDLVIQIIFLSLIVILTIILIAIP